MENILLKERRVKNYRQYLEVLKKSFGKMKQMPSDEDVRDFITKYDLYEDWHIVVSEVRADISKLIYKKISECNLDSISSYEEYLKKLKENFGIPNTMPDISMIKSFIEEYDLENKYGITVDDVRKDLESFIAGKYDEMIMDAMLKHKPYVKRYASQSYSSYPVRTEKRIFQPKQKIKKTIFLDGDNNINETKRGIEHTTKDIEVRAYFSQKGAKRKFDKEFGNRPNVLLKLVKPGDQAVDNQIKSEVGKLSKDKNQDITIVSKDKGFDPFVKVKKKSGIRISRAESVREALLGKK